MNLPNVQNLPPFVRFLVRPVEDRTKLLESGMYGFRDMEIAQITRPGSRDNVEKDPQQWLAELTKRAADGLVPREWVSHFKEQYKAWKEGMDLPVSGTPVRGWPVLSPAQQENLLLLNVRTVEELAAANEELVGRIGLGGQSMKQKAVAWLEQARTAGTVVARMDAVETENLQLKTQLEEALQELRLLRAQRQVEQAAKAPAASNF